MKLLKFWLLPLPIIIILVVFRYLHQKETFPISESEDELVEVEMESIIRPTLHYNIPIDTLELVEGKVKWNQNLSEILIDYNISFQDLHTLSQRSKEVYDVRRLRAGAKYCILHKQDSLRKATHFIFEPSLTEYVVYHLEDSIFAEHFFKEVEVKERSFASHIESSLYNAVLDQGSSPLLVSKLVDVFAWQVDFFRIAKGDKFKIIFDEEVVDGRVVGIAAIKGAYFEHLGKEYYAIPFPVNKRVDFFDEEGNSLRKTFLRAPLNFTRISSRYSIRRFHPIQKRYKAHLGTDYAAPTGTPIRTVGDGVVLESRYHRGNGNYVKIKHNSNYTTQYLHMSQIAKGIKHGVKVQQGQTIGFVGSTGLANGPHLCFRFWKNGRQVDALKVDLPSSEGIAEDQKEAFKKVSIDVKLKLDKLDYVKSKKFLAEIPK